MHYNWYRQYDPTTGRYTQPDPLGLIDGPSRYAYVTNDPMQLIDPDGRVAFVLAAPTVGGWVSGIAGAVAGIIIGDILLNDKSKEDKKGEVKDPDSCPAPIPDDPTTPPGPDWEWHGNPDYPAGSDKGAWVNTETGEQLHPDLDHGAPIGPHWDYTDPSGNRTRYRPK